ncbi:pilin [bacterium]|nr:pilin [bacterium]
MKINIVSKIIIAVLLTVCLQMMIPVNELQATSAKDQFNSGLNSTGQESGHVVKTGETASWFQSASLSQIIGRMVKALLSLLGVIFLVLTIYGGFTWMMARGNEQEVTKAQGILQTAIIGLIIVLAAYAITIFVGTVFTETSDAGCAPGEVMTEEGCSEPET